MTLLCGHVRLMRMYQETLGPRAFRARLYILLMMMHPRKILAHRTHNEEADTQAKSFTCSDHTACRLFSQNPSGLQLSFACGVCSPSPSCCLSSPLAWCPGDTWVPRCRADTTATGLGRADIQGGGRPRLCPPSPRAHDHWHCPVTEVIQMRHRTGIESHLHVTLQQGPGRSSIMTPQGAQGVSFHEVTMLLFRTLSQGK